MRNAAAGRWRRVSNRACMSQFYCFFYCYHLGRGVTALQHWDGQDTAARNQIGRGEATSDTTIFPCVSDAKHTALCFFSRLSAEYLRSEQWWSPTTRYKTKPYWGSRKDERHSARTETQLITDSKHGIVSDGMAWWTAKDTWCPDHLAATTCHINAFRTWVRAALPLGFNNSSVIWEDHTSHGYCGQHPAYAADVSQGAEWQGVGVVSLPTPAMLVKGQGVSVSKYV